jgi:hypothetical protein
MAAALGDLADGTAARLCFHLQQPSYNTDARCAGSQGRGRAGLSRTGRSSGAAQRQSWIVANVVHIA